MKKFSLAVACILFVIPVVLHAAKNDSVPKALLPVYRNNLKFNPTPMILWDWKNITFSYERVLGSRHSISVELGFLAMPALFEDTIAGLINLTSHQKNGINATVEYRYYVTKLNTRPVPAGLYVGSYLTYYGYKFKNNFDILHTSNDVTSYMAGKFWSFSLGVELGYQFVFWKRMSVDLVLLGPSISYYGGSTEVSSNVSSGDVGKIYEAIYDHMKEKFPFTKYLSPNESYKQTGKLDVTRMGLRYLVQIGFLF